MGVRIAHARHDENGGISGGRPGDQTGKEVCITEWYSRPWNVVLRAPTFASREAIAQAAEDAADNDHIGYSQTDRITLYKEMVKAGSIKDIKTDVNCDCSSLVACCCIAAGYTEVSPHIYTGVERIELACEGFLCYYSSDMVDSPDQLLRGDILLYEGHHTAIVLDDGRDMAYSEDGWHKGISGLWSYIENGQAYTNRWADIVSRTDGKTYVYHFDAEGYADLGITYIDGHLYYFAETKDYHECQLCMTDKKTGALAPFSK